MQFVPEDPIHPGEILDQDFLTEYELSLTEAASAIGVDAADLADVVRGSTAISAGLALRLGRYFNTSPEFWLNLLRSFDLAVALKTVNDLDNIKPVRAA
jgi:addiction module HigA family antidote